MRRAQYLGIVASLVALSVVPLAMSGGTTAKASASSQPAHIDCEYSRTCLDVQDQSVFDQYTGHDEPSTLFYSNTPGAGNRMQYNVTLPKDPSPENPTSKSYQFELNGALWFGLALCDTTSYPEQVSTCTPDSDSNIPSTLTQHPGTAFLELQFYPPGWIPWPTWQSAIGASSCDPTRWCAAMNIDSLLEDPVHGTTINSTCESHVGLETVNFAFLTHNGVAQAPANPVQSTVTTFTPDKEKDLFMASGDNLAIQIHDTPDGLQTTIHDRTSGETGSMTASPANGFGHVEYDPTGDSCVNLPYAFHPEYSTSSPLTRVPWAAHSYNVSFADEIGHFQTCTGPNAIPATQFGTACPAGDTENAGFSTAAPTDSDEQTCFPGSMALVIHISACTDSNSGFDGFDYQPVYADGNPLHTQSFKFSSPLTGAGYNVRYSQMGFEADLPAIEASVGTCNRTTGAGCSLIPITDAGKPANFYPFFSTIASPQGQDQQGDSNGQGDDQGNPCVWQFGNDTPGTIRDFDKNAQYGSLLFETFLRFGAGGATRVITDNFRQIITNPC